MRTINAVLLGMIVGLFSTLHAQEWRLSGGGAYLVPIAGLSERFDPQFAFAVGLGKQRDDRWLWGGRIEFVRFNRENTEKLFVKNVPLKLEIYGGTVEAQYGLASSRHSLRPHLIGSAGIYRWFSTHGAYQDSAVALSEFKQKDWSWGFGGGLGVEYQFLKSIMLFAETRYQMIIGELWPTLAVRLENVSTFQWVAINLGMKMQF